MSEPASCDRHRRYREAHREEINERRRLRREANPEADREAQRRYREANREAVRERGRESSHRYREANREAVREQRRNSYQANREAIREQQRRYYEANGEKFAERKRRWREANPEAEREYKRRYYEANRDAVFTHYSPYSPPRCACCDATKNLTIDHVNGGGGDHRKEIFGRQVGGVHFYLWLIKENFPPGFAVLCMPCNNSKREGKRCRLEHNVDPLPGQCVLFDLGDVDGET